MHSTDVADETLPYRVGHLRPIDATRKTKYGGARPSIRGSSTGDQQVPAFVLLGRRDGGQHENRIQRNIHREIWYHQMMERSDSLSLQEW